MILFQSISYQQEREKTLETRAAQVKAEAKAEELQEKLQELLVMVD
jgi:hypothetical protein